jgi:hypothetical protein
MARQSADLQSFVMTLQKWLPVVTSIAIIVLVAVLRERSRTLAAIVATMPINIPLALWVVFGAGDADMSTVEPFVRKILVGIVPTMIWIAVVYIGVRNEQPLLASIVVGYVVWALVTLLARGLGLL